ncbi:MULTISPECIES: pyruvate:ferredoxin (flavodoxin) oxidoreductase [Mogibacterium]|uniref:Pyruvate:ferredoxin oxidoreductase n=1 Tax=Mogibacterium timidum ATCC 33093 TaxID=1401079 RepID=X8INR5_9FIRM|nr:MULTISPECIES: pyruvate:ferredoxin (flavodoxin) oxidoreductase [Mogibacterium]EUC51748.1 pyruvate synthase [Mogibacterium timidum ATCC 33093]
MNKVKRIKKTMDGNTAAAHVAYAFSEVSAIYPITPSSVMAENIDKWASEGRKNLFGEKVCIVEMQSEGGAAGAVHGALNTGALTSTYTSSQGLLLMIPNMYKIAGEQLPGVFHVAARAVSTHALSIFGDHSDVMAARATGVGMIAANSPQEVMDLAAVSHLAAIKSSMPILHFFDGFRTSHEQQKIEVWDYDTLGSLLDYDAVDKFRNRANNPCHPHLMGSAEQPETFFQHNEARNKSYDESIDIIKGVMDQVNKCIGTDYKPFNYYGAPDATDVIVAMGSVCETAAEVVDYLNKNDGRKVGLIKVRLFRPFSSKCFVEELPNTVKNISVLDRTKEPGSNGEPLYLDVVSALADAEDIRVKLTRGRYGLGSKDTQPGDIIAVYDNMASDIPKKEFTISITDDVTNLSLERKSNPIVSAEGTVACKFWGLGADGTVGANKNSVKIIGNHTDRYVQAYFQYDSKKSGGVTISHLRFGDNPIRSTYYVNSADFIACHSASYMHKYDIVQDVNPGGIFLLNCSWSDEELDKNLPAAAKRYIAENNIQFYTCDAVKLANEVGLGSRRTNTVLQAAFFKLVNIMPIEEAVDYMKAAIKKSYISKGDDIVSMNCKAVDAGVSHVHKVAVPDLWRSITVSDDKVELQSDRPEMVKYLNDILITDAAMKGDEIPTSKFLDFADGLIPAGTAAFEKRGIAIDVPLWIADNCIQCNLCAYSCPHGVIRPFALSDADAKAAGGITLQSKANGDFRFMISVSTVNCTGCGSCVDVCPAKEKALKMIPYEDERSAAQQKVFEYANDHTDERILDGNRENPRNIGFIKPLLEFSGACPGCGETPYAKLVTQLFGDRMFIANATGCSSIWGGSAPSTPYTINREGRGPAWSNSLFEDNAEFGLGMAISMKTRRNEMRSAVKRLADKKAFHKEATEWIEAMDDDRVAELAAAKLISVCSGSDNDDAKFVMNNRDLLPKPSMWIFGGDGWAYDIGYGGLDHVIASGENVNILVFDTEVYSNTGGQASKATPAGAIAQFAASGKTVGKKNLAEIAMSYGYVYVAQVAMGANPSQTLAALREAESYNGPSIVIAYSPCINHGIRAGMNCSMNEMKKAVQSGYWNLFRFDPRRTANGQNPLMLDSKKPTLEYNDFLKGEVRYRALEQTNPKRAKQLFAEAAKQANDRYETLVKRSKMDK